MTITNESAAKKMLFNDLTIKRMYVYTNLLSGTVMYAAFEDPAHDDMNVSPFVLNPVLLKDEGNCTAQGLALLTGNEEYGYKAEGIKPATRY